MKKKISIFVLAILLAFFINSSSNISAENSNNDDVDNTKDDDKNIEELRRRYNISEDVRVFTSLAAFNKVKDTLNEDEWFTIILEEGEQNNFATMSEKSISAKAVITAKKVSSWKGWKSSTGKWGVDNYIYKSGSDYLYCIQPGVMHALSGYTKGDNLNDYLEKKYGISKTLKATYYALHGTRLAKSNQNYYMATQLLVWEALFGGTYTTGNSTVNSYKNTVKAKANEHTKRVSFNAQTKVVKAGTTLTLTDTYNQLSSYFTIDNAAAFKTATGMTVTKSGNTIKVSNPALNAKNSTSKVTMTKYKGWFDKGTGYRMYHSSAQDQASFGEKDPVPAYVSFKAASIVGGAELYKNLDGIDLYEKNIKDEKDVLIYNTSDGKFKYTEEDGIVTSVNYPSEAVMKEKDLYKKKISYQSPVLEPVMIEVNKLDQDGNPILIVDENGVQPGEPGYVETIEKESVQKKTDDGQLIYKAKRENNEVVYQTVELDMLYPDENGMKRLRPGAAKFRFTDSTGKVIATLTSDATTGKISIPNLLPGNYFYEEIEAPEGYEITPGKKPFKVETSKITKINNGVALLNFELSGLVELIKVDKDFKERLLNGAGFELYESNDAGEYDSFKPVAYLETVDGISKVTYPEGIYILKEIKAPDGYVLDHKEYKLEIKNKETTKITIENEQIKENFEVWKVDENNLGMKLANAEYGIYSQDDKGKLSLIKKVKSSKEKAITFTGTSDMKNVCFIELTAPRDYIIDKKPKCFKIDEAGFYNKETFTNKKRMMLTLPNTGANNTLAIIGSLLSASVGIGSIIFRRTRLTLVSKL